MTIDLRREVTVKRYDPTGPRGEWGVYYEGIETPDIAPTKELAIKRAKGFCRLRLNHNGVLSRLIILKVNGEVEMQQDYPIKRKRGLW